MSARFDEGAEGREPAEAEADVDRSPSGALRVAHFDDDDGAADAGRRALPAEALRGLSRLAAMGWVTPC